MTKKLPTHNASIFAVGQAAATAAKEDRVVKSRGPTLPALDLSQMKVRNDVPRPSSRYAASMAARYEPFFDMLAAVNNSIEVDLAYMATLKRSAQTYCKNHPGRKFTVRKVSDSKCCVWRIK